MIDEIANQQIGSPNFTNLYGFVDGVQKKWKKEEFNKELKRKKVRCGKEKWINKVIRTLMIENRAWVVDGKVDVKVESNGG